MQERRDGREMVAVFPQTFRAAENQRKRTEKEFGPAGSDRLQQTVCTSCTFQTVSPFFHNECTM